jgi:hypothetical protein
VRAKQQKHEQKAWRAAAASDDDGTAASHPFSLVFSCCLSLSRRVLTERECVLFVFVL